MCKRISFSHLRLFVTDEGLMTRELCDCHARVINNLTTIVIKQVLRVVLILTIISFNRTEYGGPVGRAREQCTQILETVDAAQPNSRRSARARNDVVRSAVLRSAVVRKCGVQYYGVQ